MLGRGLFRRSKYAKRGQQHVIVNTPGGPQHFAASIPRDILDYRSLLEIQTHKKPVNKRARRYYWRHRDEILAKRKQNARRKADDDEVEMLDAGDVEEGDNYLQKKAELEKKKNAFIIKYHSLDDPDKVEWVVKMLHPNATEDELEKIYEKIEAEESEIRALEAELKTHSSYGTDFVKDRVAKLQAAKTSLSEASGPMKDVANSKPATTMELPKAEGVVTFQKNPVVTQPRPTKATKKEPSRADVGEQNLVPRRSRRLASKIPTRRGRSGRGLEPTSRINYAELAKKISMQ